MEITFCVVDLFGRMSCPKTLDYNQRTIIGKDQPKPLSLNFILYRF
jgi:hypothetical protein